MVALKSILDVMERTQAQPERVLVHKLMRKFHQGMSIPLAYMVGSSHL